MASAQRGREGKPSEPQPVRPVHEVRLGRVKAVVWANDGEHGVRYSVSVARVYKDKQDRWQTTESFGRDDLLVLAKVCDLAHTWISEATKGQDVPF
jgi:hypothetical protein